MALNQPARAHGAPAKPKGVGRQFYASRYDASSPAATTSRYLFFSSQRTGSTYLCRRLSNIKGRFGLPAEYLNPNAIEDMTPRMPKPPAGQPLTLAKYLQGIERLRTTADGAFGIKVQPKQIVSRFPGRPEAVVKFLQRYDRVIVLTRRDKLGQAVSGSIAEASGDWNASEEPEMTDEQLDQLCPDVAFKLNRYIQEEMRMRTAASQTGRPVLYIDYAEILADPEVTFNNLLVYLGEPRGTAGVEEQELVSVPKKRAGQLAERLTRRFLDYITAAGPYSAPRPG